MKSVIREMLRGKTGSFERIKNSPEYFELLDIAVKREAEFKAKLVKHNKLTELYSNASIAIDKLNCESEVSHYTEGFKFGLLLGLEVAGE